MSLTIDKNTLEQAQTLLTQNKVSEAWQVLGNAGDNYALNAAKITNQGTDSFAKTLVKETWENTVGVDLYNQKFDLVAQLHLANYLKAIKVLNDALPEDNNLFVLPKTDQIEQSYGSSLEDNGIPPKAAIDGILNTAVRDTVIPGWTKWLDLFDGHWGNESDIEDERISNDPYLDSGYSRFEAVLKISQIGSEAVYSDSGFEGDVEIVSNYVKDLYGDSASFLENLFAKEIEEQRLSDPSKSNSYIVNSNDTLANIASIYGITVDELIASNPQLTSQGRISRDGAYVLIKPGETLNIPSDATIDEDSEYCTYTGENMGALNSEEQSALQDVLGILNPTSLREVSAAILGKVNSSINSITQSVSNSYTTFSNSVTNAIVRVDPLVIDLNGDGLKLNSWQQSDVTFDLNGDGFSESTGWTTSSSDDAFLVLDKNSNGNVDSIDELFGNSSSTGFEVLKKFDSNADNVINSNDAQFNLLKLWKDSNANGVVNEGELTFLGDNGITEISLKTLNNLYSSSGNLVTETAEVKITDSQTNIVSTRTVSEVLFAMNQFNSSISNPDEALGPNFTLDINTLLLPYSRGYGSLNSWQVAMTLNSELLETAQTLANLSPSNFYQINSLFETFLFQWAGVEDVTASQVYESGTSTKIDHRKVAFLEKATGLDFRVPNDAVIAQSQTSWDLFYNTLLTRFLTQGTFKEIFPDASYSFSADTTSINTTLDEAIANILSLSGSLDKNSFLNYAYYSKTILQLNKDQFTSETNSTFDSKVNSMLNSIINSVAIPNFSFNGIFNIGTDASETLYGSANSDIVKGLEGDDFIYAESGNDYIEGNEGSDYLKGGAGDDIYKFNLGDGQDTIEETSGTDKIVFGSGITQTSLAFAMIGVDLLISITNSSDATSSDKIGIKNFYSATGNRVETLEFSDGGSFNLGSLNIISYGTEANDTLYGSNDSDIISAGAGDDLIYTYYGDDIITGGTGNDYIENYNDTGNDTYIFNLGDGQDVILEDFGTDKIIFGAGITKEDIILVEDLANENSLILRIRNTTDQIRIRLFFAYDSLLRKIETLQFSDGSTMSLVGSLSINGSKIAGEALKGSSSSDSITGNIGNDQIYSGDGNDVVAGGKGNDYLEAGFGSGDNSYIFNLGDGQDEIRDYLGSDRIIFGTGISSSDITLIPSMANSESLVIKIGNAGDQITIISFFQFQHNVSKIETLQFADGSTINLANGLTLQGYNLSGEKLTGTDYDDAITGNIGNDEIRGGNGNDTLKGGDGNDIIYANGGDDIITGGKGNDYAENYQETGNDTYIFNLGDGQDIIFDDFGSDKIIFGAGISQSDIVLTQDDANENSLIIKVGTSGDQIRIRFFFWREDTQRKIETLEFADGSTMSLIGSLAINGNNAAGEVLRATAYDDHIIGNVGNDTIYAGAGNDVVNGGDGDDVIFANGGDDVITGGKGNDYAENYQETGNDSYIFNLGDGQDVIFDEWGNDRIIFGAGISQGDILLTHDDSIENSLIIKVGTGGDQIKIRFFFWREDTQRKIETLQFADGSTMSLIDGLAISASNVAGENLHGTGHADSIIGNIGNDTIYAGDGNDVVMGGDGDDVIFANGGDDIITGGKGNDYAENYQESGNDTYIFNLGDGQDLIFDDFGSDKIIFGEGISPSDILLIQDDAHENSLIIKVGAGGDQIKIRFFFWREDTQRKIETLQFADGSTMSLIGGLTINGSNPIGESLRGTAYGDNIIGNIGDDVIFAKGGDDIITGGKGNDYIENYQETGNDTYIFNLGDGQDLIFDDFGSDKIIFGAGISAQDITLIQDDANENSLIIKVGNDGDQIKIRFFFWRDDTQRKIETLQFADGSTMSLIGGLTINGSNPAGESLRGTAYDDNIIGNIGDDVIFANGGDDIITGGKGNDYIENYQETGNDTYIFNLGDGQDVIFDDFGSDKIIFGEGISQGDIVLTQDDAHENSLIIKVGTAGDQIKIRFFLWREDTQRKIETLEFADGSTMSLTGGLTINGSNPAGESLRGTGAQDTIIGNAGNDTIYAGAGNDVVNSGDGDDVIFANDGDDIITGGKGNDYFENYLESGNDTYIFNLGDGQDIIFDDFGTDKIIFGEGIFQSDIFLIQDSALENSLIIKVGNGGDQIRVRFFFWRDDTRRKIETLQFADGSTMSLIDGLVINGIKTAGETLIGTLYGDNIIGNIGNDTIDGGYGDDILNGGKGNDILSEVVASNDTYIFNLGDGQDVIYEYRGNDKIIFGERISQADIILIPNYTLEYSLIVKIGADGDQIRLANFFYNADSERKIEALQFADGSTMSLTSGLTIRGLNSAGETIFGINSYSDNLIGNVGSDVLLGLSGEDLLEGGLGNDELRGGLDSDTYFFDSGHGNDFIYEEGGATDIISFGSEIAASSLTMLRSGNDLAIFQQGVTDSVTISNFFQLSASRIEYLQFENGEKFDLSAIQRFNENVSYAIGNYNITKEDTAVKIKLLNLDEQNNDYSNVEIISNPLNGAVTKDASGDIIYTPNANYNGNDSFDISYLDELGEQQSKNITVNVLSVNDAPIASNLNLTVSEDAALEISTASAASDIDNDSLLFSAITSASRGNVKIENGKIIYTPSANFFGSDSFNYTISDGNGGSDSKTVSLTILSVNDAPIASNDAVSTNEDQAVAINVTNNDRDVETGFFSGSNINIVEAPLNGSVTIQSDGKIYYTPNADYYGQDSFKYSLTDSDGAVSNAATVTIAIAMVNDVPKAKANTQISFNEDEVKIFNLSDYFYDPDGDAFTAVSLSAQNGTAQINGNQISYLANSNFNGVEHLTFNLQDSYGASNILNIQTTVSAVNDAPLAQDDNFILAEDVPTKIAILSNDVDVEDVLFVSSISNITTPLHGIVSVNSNDGTLFYVPNKDFFGTDFFNYTIQDSKGLTSTAKVNITVTGVNDVPLAAAITQTGSEDCTIVIDVLAVASDVEGDALTINLVNSGLHGVAAIVTNAQGKRVISYTPNANFNGVDQLTYQVTDSNGAASLVSAIDLNIAAVYDSVKILRPIATKQAQVNKEFIYKLDVATLLSNVDNYSLEIAIKNSDGSALPSWLIFDPNNLELRGTPSAESYGLKSFILTVFDGTSTVQSAFNISIDQELQAATNANVITAATPNGVEANVAAIDGSTDLVMGGEEGDIIQYGGDEVWSDAFMAYNFYSDDLMSVTGKLRSFDAFDGQGGSDFIKLTNSDDGLFLDDLFSSNSSSSGSRLSNIEGISGEDGDDIIDLSSDVFTYGSITLNGGAGNDILWSNDGDDILNGDAGNDHLVGGRGYDSIFGGEGDDILKGCDGDDILTGGSGSDTLSGGSGNDIFNFENLADSTINYCDLITDFTQGEDSINLSNLNFTSLANNLSYHYDNANNTTIIEDNTQSFIIKLTGNLELEESDFNFG